ncbi:MscL family protein, partial [Neisseria sp. P0015.S010]
PAVGYAILADALAACGVNMNIGLLINTVFSFLIVAAAMFCVVKAINSLKNSDAPAEEAPAEPSEEVLLLRVIRDSMNKN